MSVTKGIILAGGKGSRLHPITKGISKQLLPLYDKPMIYYPLSVLMLAKIRDILIITSPEYLDNFKNLLGDGKNFGINLTYAVQPKPDGLAQAFIIGEKFIGTDNVCLALGDNIFHGHGLSNILKKASEDLSGATIFAYKVNDPKNFGVVIFDENKKVIAVEEKPIKYKSDFAITGLYFYNNDVIEIAKTIKPSKRGELEITSVNRAYMERGNLNVELLGRGFTWLDTGNQDSLLQAANYISLIQNRQNTKIACLEEIALYNDWINKDKILKISRDLRNTSYGQYLEDLIDK